MTDSTEMGIRLQLLRLNILPPYTEDLDESERDPEEYVAFFRERAKSFVSVVREYRESLHAGLEDPDDVGRVGRYLNARAEFVRGLPFCLDVIGGEVVDEELVGYIQNWWRKGRYDHSGYWELGRLEEFEMLLQELSTWV